VRRLSCLELRCAAGLAWISTEKNFTNAGLTQGIHLTREFGSDCYPK
jgi:hypothetical protein